MGHAAILVVIGACSGSPDGTSVTMPEAGPGIGFDDLQYSPALHRVLVPGGRSDVGHAWVCDPDHGKLWRVDDTYAASE